MNHNSSTRGYMRPTTTQKLPGNLTLNQFLQTVLVGISGLDGPLVRPSWQIAPPKQPDIAVNWLAFGINRNVPDANAYVGMDADGNTTTQRHEELEILCSFYGPDAFDISSLVRDGFQIQQNLEALRAANMGFKETTPALQMPDLINERFVQKIVMSIYLRREIQREYPILSITSANGVIHTVLGNEEYLMNWETPELVES